MTGDKVMLGFAHGGTVRAEFMMSVLGLLDPPQGLQVTQVQGPEISANRNQLTAWFLESGRDWLWMTDTDMVFSRLTLPALLQAADPVRRPVLSALCMTAADAGGKPVPAMKTFGGASRFSQIASWKPGEILRVAGAGAACILVHRSAFERISESCEELWWSCIVTDDGRQVGEDLSFCLRCAASGIPVHVHTGVQAGHVKPLMLGRVSP